MFRGLQSGKCLKSVAEEPWPLLGLSFTPSHCSQTQHMSCQVPVAPDGRGAILSCVGLCQECTYPHTLPAFSLFFPMSVSVPVPRQEGCWEVSCHEGPAGPLSRADGAVALVLEGQWSPGSSLPGWTGWAGFSESGNVLAVTPPGPGVVVTCSDLELFCLLRSSPPSSPCPGDLPPACTAVLPGSEGVWQPWSHGRRRWHHCFVRI